MSLRDFIVLNKLGRCLLLYSHVDRKRVILRGIQGQEDHRQQGLCAQKGKEIVEIYYNRDIKFCEII